MALEAIGQEQRRKLAVAGELDPEHLVRLALVPSRSGEHAAHTVDGRIVAADPSAQQQ
jgi:hypothetical protein